ncbi:hypothetical protein [Thermogemmatispora carboxidivorans]|uniref:hypothetical protein n=1 Tax=Thermogemmatispora carboxidivorans TaxID=1382306 RepID=UPI0006999865|nr:hypothetical protein [Thermogemmatispora carboxidivorans]
MLEEQITEIPPETEGGKIDPRKCYVCGAKATALCARCQMPVCPEHQQSTRDYITKIATILCDDCADYYEALIKP